MFEIIVTKQYIQNIKDRFEKLPWLDIVIGLSFLISSFAIGISFLNGWLLSYGDAQSHINISKRVVDSITPGFAQLGGVWLPLPHLLMIPFVKIEFLYRTGLAGSIVSGLAFAISAIYVFRTALFITKNNLASFVAFLVFALNPNILYLQTTALTESSLICFFVLSSYYFINFLVIVFKSKRFKLKTEDKHREYLNLILAGFFGFCASLSRYDGWFLVFFEAMLIILAFLPFEKSLQVLKDRKFGGIKYLIKEKFFYGDSNSFNKMQGLFIMFSIVAFMGIAMWLIWDGLILGDPFYFTDSVYSAKTQQLAWLHRGELPAFHNLFVSFQYYFLDSMTNLGVIIFATALLGLYIFLTKNKKILTYFIALIFFIPFIFNVLTLFMGQSVIFIPHITPTTFEWTLFNARYGILMLPAASVFIAILFYYARTKARVFIIVLIFLQMGLYATGYSRALAFTDGTTGLSASKLSDADLWMKKNYDGGLVLMDDFARSINIIEDDLPVQNILYSGNKPYYPDSLKAPEKYATWIVVQKNDDVWKNIYNKPAIRARLYKYFVKVYTSPNILIFKRMK